MEYSVRVMFQLSAALVSMILCVRITECYIIYERITIILTPYCCTMVPKIRVHPEMLLVLRYVQIKCSSQTKWEFKELTLTTSPHKCYWRIHCSMITDDSTTQISCPAFECNARQSGNCWFLHGRVTLITMRNCIRDVAQI